ncbi:IS66 family transposase [Pseudomonas asiatica]|uniref:IS66 family transposase n=1 Tax=Pseudomonas asiatica TaxID=2219225 RepID=UPI0024481813|nr:transposase [Pseudomonas asiatica]MDH0136210.1 IS66 family transposase [Pseudomonas asiatica]
MANPSVLAMLLTTKYVDSIPLHRFESILSQYGIEIPPTKSGPLDDPVQRTFPILLNLMCERLLESPVVHCDETRVQVLK